MTQLQDAEFVLSPAGPVGPVAPVVPGIPCGPWVPVGPVGPTLMEQQQFCFGCNSAYSRMVRSAFL